MHKLYVTGDQRMDPPTAFDVVYKLAGKLMRRSMERGIPLSEVQLMTGDSPVGIERAMRYLYADVAPLIIMHYPVGRDGKIDYVGAFQSMDVDHIVILDEDPLSSPIAQAAFKVFGEEKVHLVLDRVLADD
jgi:hypothetical protein